MPSSGPREDATRIGSAGVVRRQAVDISPLRRVNQAIYLLTTGARESAFRNIKTIAECLADELINAAKGSSNRYLITLWGLQSSLFCFLSKTMPLYWVGIDFHFSWTFSIMQLCNQEEGWDWACCKGKSLSMRRDADYVTCLPSMIPWAIAIYFKESPGNLFSFICRSNFSLAFEFGSSMDLLLDCISALSRGCY